VKIDKGKYERIRASILSGLKRKEFTYTERADWAERKVSGKFEGSVRWDVETR
jgi:hypothetical protein